MSTDPESTIHIRGKELETVPTDTTELDIYFENGLPTSEQVVELLERVKLRTLKLGNYSMSMETLKAMGRHSTLQTLVFYDGGYFSPLNLELIILRNEGITELEVRGYTLSKLEIYLISMNQNIRTLRLYGNELNPGYLVPLEKMANLTKFESGPFHEEGRPLPLYNRFENEDLLAVASNPSLKRLILFDFYEEGDIDYRGYVPLINNNHLEYLKIGFVSIEDVDVFDEVLREYLPTNTVLKDDGREDMTPGDIAYLYGRNLDTRSLGEMCHRG